MSALRRRHPDSRGPPLVARENEHAVVADRGRRVLLERGLEVERPQRIAIRRSDSEEGHVVHRHDLANPFMRERHGRRIRGRPVQPPHFLSCCLVVGNQGSLIFPLLGARDANRHDEQIALDQGRRGRSPDRVRLAVGVFEGLFPTHGTRVGVQGQEAFPDAEAVDRIAFSQHGRLRTRAILDGRRSGLIGHRVAMPPEFLAGRRRQGEHHFLFALPREDENAVAGNDGRRLAPSHADLPKLMESRGKHGRQLGAGCYAVAIRPPPLRPVGALCGRSESQRAEEEQCRRPSPDRRT